MKDFKQILSAVVVLALLGFAVVAYFQGKKDGLEDIEQAERRLLAVIDSLKSIPPEVKIDTFIGPTPDPIVKWYPKYIEKPVDQPKEYLNQDSLINEEISLYINDSIRGALFFRNVGYSLKVPKTIEVTKTIIEKIPEPYEVPVPTYYDGFWIGTEVGGGSGFAYSFGAGYNKGRHKFGLEYLRYAGTDNWMIGYEYLIFKRK